jgi:hypothetical protein
MTDHWAPSSLSQASHPVSALKLQDLEKTGIYYNHPRSQMPMILAAGLRTEAMRPNSHGVEGRKATEGP